MRIEGILSLGHLETRGELQPFRAAVNWVHTNLPEINKTPLSGV